MSNDRIHLLPGLSGVGPYDTPNRGSAAPAIHQRISGAPDADRLRQIIDGGPSHQPRVAFMPGPSLTQSLQLRQEISLKISIKQLDPIGDWEAIYDQAEKRTYSKHGLEFEYAVVKRSEFPYMLHIGSAGMYVGNYFVGGIFVMEEFFVDPKIDEESKRKIVELIAVHEFGESVFGDHHQASLLEFEVARREGFLEEYLEILDDKYFLKFRDVSLARMGKELLEAIEMTGAVESVEKSEEQESPADEPPQTFSDSAQNAASLRDAFRWPPNLYDRYHDALDEDEELAREKVEDWAKYIVVNEQARAYFNKAAQATIDKAGEVLKTDVPVVSALSDMTAAFYAALYPFYSEVTEELLPKDYFEPDLLKTALKEAYEEITLGVARHIEAKVLPTQRMSILRVVRGQPLFKRNLEDHFDILKSVSEWREAFEASDIEEESTNLFWRIVGDKVRSGAAPTQEVALRQTAGEAEELGALYKKLSEVEFNDSSPYPELAVKHYEAKLLWALVQEFSDHSGDYETTSLQGIIDLLTEKRGVKIDIAKLREKYGRVLEGYQTAENSPDRLYLKQLSDFYSRAGDAEQHAYVIREADRLLGSPADVAKAYRESTISEALAVGMLQEFGSAFGDFEAFKRRLSILPYLVAKYKLTRDEANALVKEVFESDFEIQRFDERDLFLKVVLGEGSPLESTNQITAWQLAVGKRLGEQVQPGVSAALPEIYDQPGNIEKWRAILAPQEEVVGNRDLVLAFSERLFESNYAFIDGLPDSSLQDLVSLSSEGDWSLHDVVDSYRIVTGTNETIKDPRLIPLLERFLRLGLPIVNLSALQMLVAASRNRPDRSAYLGTMITTDAARTLESYAADGSRRACEIMMDLIEAGGFDYLKSALADSHDTDWERSTDDDEVMTFLRRLAPYNQEAKTLVVNERVRKIMKAQQIPWSDIGELAELAAVSEAAREALRRIRFSGYSPEHIAILKRIPPAARNELCVQILRRVEIEELRSRAASKVAALERERAKKAKSDQKKGPPSGSGSLLGAFLLAGAMAHTPEWESVQEPVDVQETPVILDEESQNLSADRSPEENDGSASIHQGRRQYVFRHGPQGRFTARGSMLARTRAVGVLR